MNSRHIDLKRTSWICAKEKANHVQVRHERDFFINNLLVRIQFIIVMIRWTGFAPRECEFPFPGSPHLPSQRSGAAASHTLDLSIARSRVQGSWNRVSGAAVGFAVQIADRSEGRSLRVVLPGGERRRQRV